MWPIITASWCRRVIKVHGVGYSRCEAVQYKVRLTYGGEGEGQRCSRHRLVKIDWGQRRGILILYL